MTPSRAAPARPGHPALRGQQRQRPGGPHDRGPALWRLPPDLHRQPAVHQAGHLGRLRHPASLARPATEGGSVSVDATPSSGSRLSGRGSCWSATSSASPARARPPAPAAPSPRRRSRHFRRRWPRAGSSPRSWPTSPGGLPSGESTGHPESDETEQAHGCQHRHRPAEQLKHALDRSGVVDLAPVSDGSGFPRLHTPLLTALKRLPRRDERRHLFRSSFLV
jgi:hypothetical protein